MSNKVYLIYSQNQIDIVSTWDECKALTHGIKGKLFKSFSEKEKREMALWLLEKAFKEKEDIKVEREKEIQDKLNLSDIEIKEIYSSLGDSHYKKDFKELQDYLDKIEKDNYVAYVDGSYNINTKEYSYGLNIVYKGKTVFEDAKKYPDKNGMRQINGELKAAIIACNFAINNKIKDLYIAYDYEGIEKFATLKWTPKTSDIEFYRDIMQRNIKNMNIGFIKIPAHEKFVNNEKADLLAKQILGIKK